MLETKPEPKNNELMKHLYKKACSYNSASTKIKMEPNEKQSWDWIKTQELYSGITNFIKIV